VANCESLRRTSNRQKKGPITRSKDFFMATTVADSAKNLSSNQLSNNILEQVYKSQLLVNLNANELYSVHRH